MRTLAVLALAFMPIASAQEAAPADSPNADPLETLREHWDADNITGAMVDEIKKVLDEGDAETIAPLLRRIELLGRESEAYAPDFALWWDVRGRAEIGGKTFWRRDLVREALNAAMMEHDQAKTMTLLDEAAETGDPVARMWLSFYARMVMGEHDDAATMREMFALADEVRELANAGDPEASLLLAIAVPESDFELMRPSPQEMLQWLETAVEAEYFYAEKLFADAYALQLQASSSNNLKQMGLVGKMYANESAGEYWPLLSAEPAQLAMNADEIYPEYLTDPQVVISPAHPDRHQLEQLAVEQPERVIRDHSYWYLGYALDSEEAVLTFVKAVKAAAQSGETLIGDIDAPDLPLGQIVRLREGIERFFITDIHDPRASATTQSTIPVMIERPGMHDIGANVLYLDGHVEFLKYPSHFPMTETVIEALESLDAFKKQQ
jgi:prepilin-type processing-associated H-X9-DG protein